MSRKKVLVTGGAGYVGSALVPRLLLRGYDVRVFDRLTFGSFGLDAVKDKVELVEGDVRMPPANLMDGVWGVIHLAGLSTEPSAYFKPRYTDQVNHIGTENIARLAKKAGVERFIFSSTCSVYFTFDTPSVPISYTEESQVNSISSYALTKRAAEEALLELTDTAFKPTIFRKGTIYGFAPKMRYDLVLNSFTKDAFSKKKIFVNSGGEIFRPMLDIQDAVEAYIAALELPLEAVGGHTFNVLSSNWKIGDLAVNKFKELIALHKNIPIEVEIRVSDSITRNYLADDSKFKKVFGLTPARSIEEAILEMWDKMEGGHDFQDQRFYTDNWFKTTMA